MTSPRNTTTTIIVVSVFLLTTHPSLVDHLDNHPKSRDTPKSTRHPLKVGGGATPSVAPPWPIMTLPAKPLLGSLVEAA
jgi:hypothetical protein